LFFYNSNIHNRYLKFNLNEPVYGLNDGFFPGDVQQQLLIRQQAHSTNT